MGETGILVIPMDLSALQQSLGPSQGKLCCLLLGSVSQRVPVLGNYSKDPSSHTVFCHKPPQLQDGQELKHGQEKAANLAGSCFGSQPSSGILFC